ncbi:AraC family transcriptional regulator [Puniceicoccaceae bacterium K14]|nr:AraC family transcriptional regulator [Puniceicoccaceae bacterium K14]
MATDDAKQPNTPPQTKDYWRSAIVKAIMILEERYEDPPTVSELARASGFSHYHFQRAFKAIVGESVERHILRLRLERSAALLKSSTWQVSAIAIACGFADQSVFSRAFKKHYGISAVQFRKSEGTVPFLQGYFKSRPQENLESAGVPLPSAYLETWPDLEAICYRCYGSITDMHGHWKSLLNWSKDVFDLKEARFFGLWFDDWSGKDKVYRYECAIVPNSQYGSLTIPPPFHKRTIPSGQVSIANAHGGLKEIDRQWRAFAEGWLPFSGFQPRGEFVLDEYPSNLALASYPKQLIHLVTGFSLRMCLPIQENPLDF